MNCSLGIHRIVKKTLNDKPWFKYEEGDQYVHIVDSPNNRIVESRYIGVAETTAKAINKQVNDGYKNIGDVAYPTFLNGKGVVKIDPSTKQLKLIEAQDDAEIRELEKEIAAEQELVKQEQLLAESKAELESATNIQAFETILPSKKNLKNNLNIKEGVNKIFSENSELFNIGTPLQYSQYINTIFPNSKIKDIVYHGVVKGREAYNNILKKGFDFKTKRNWDSENSKFNEDDNTGMFFSDYNTGQSYGLELTYKINENGEYEDVGYNNVIPAILNIENLDDSNETSSSTAANFYRENKNKVNIGMFGPEGGSEGVHDNYVVFESSQIHILGSKQDIEGFKKYIDNNPFLIESKKNLKDLEGSKTDQFGKTKEPFNEEEIRYEYSEEIKNTIFAGTPSNITAKEALKNILTEGTFEKDSKENELINRMIISTKATVKIIDPKDLKSSETYMQYNTVDNTIEIALDNLGDVSSVKEGVSKFLHEVYHDRTLRILRTPKNQTEQQLYNDIKSVYNVLKPLLEEEFPHEMSSIEEFTSGMFSNTEFETQVESLINTKTNFWDKLVQFFRNLFGLDSSYDNLINQLLDLVDTSDQSYQGKDVLESRYKVGNVTRVPKKGLNSISEDIDQTLQNLENITTRSAVKNLKFSEKLQSTRTEINKLLDKYDITSDEYRLESIKIFNKFMQGQLYASDIRLDDEDDFNTRLYKQIKAYNDTFINLQKSIKNSIKELKDNKTISSDEYSELYKEVDNLSKQSAHLSDKLYERAKDAVKKINIFSDQYKETLLHYQHQFREEGKKLGLTKYDLDEYVNKKIAENRDKIQLESDQEWNDLIESPLNDISNVSAMINSEKDFNHPIIRVFSRILDSVKHTYQNIIQPKLIELQSKTDEFLKDSRLKSSDENYKNLVEWSKDDEAFLVGEYQIGFRDSFISLMNEVNSDEFGKNLTDIEKAKLKKSKLKNWFKENTFKDENGITKPKAKWKTDLSKLSQKERDYLSYIQSVAKESHENYGINVKSLKKTTLGVDYYRLPSQHKEMITHLKNAKGKEVFKEIWNDKFKLRTDDTTQGETDITEGKDVYIVHRDLSGKEVKYVPIHYRGKIDKAHQSIDLATIYALEYQNSVKFKEKTKVHADLEMFIDVIQENGFIKKQGIGKRVISYFKADGDTTPVVHSKEDAYLIKQLETMLNNRLYDKTSTYLGKIGSADVSKIESFIRGSVSRTSQALNIIGAPVNLITGKSQTILEVIRDPNLSITNIKNAEKFFFSNIGNTLDDLGRNVYKSLPNQLLMSFGGLVTSEMLQNNFEKNKTLALANTKPLFFLQEGGEHWIQSIHTMTILDSAKILDKDGNYLDKEGNITTKDKAASILDISVLENGNLTTTIKTPFYTTIDRMKSYQEGGSGTVRSYIQSSLIKTQGQYSTEYQAELQRNVMGKALFHFKKHILSPGLSRWRGFSTNAFVKTEDIVLNYESDLLRPDEGNYVTTIRFLTRTVLPKLAKLQLSLINNEWNEMDEWEKGNIVRTFSEIALIMTMASSALLFAGAAPDDDDYDGFWYAAVIARRVQSDASQYYNINEAWKTFRNPISSLKFLENSSALIGALSNYLNPIAEDRNEKMLKSSKNMFKYFLPGQAIMNNPKEQYMWNQR